MLSCTFGLMKSGKTKTMIELIRAESRDTRVGIFRATWDNEDTAKTIESRAGTRLDATDVLYSHEDVAAKVAGFDVVYIDEVQFLRPVQIEQLVLAIDQGRVGPVHCFGLLTCAQDNMSMFVTSKKLLEIADKCTLLPNEQTCFVCKTRRAVGHMKIDHDKRLYDVGSSFEVCCRLCWA